jgi:hypothetical protein
MCTFEVATTRGGLDIDPSDIGIRNSYNCPCLICRLSFVGPGSVNPYS